jgi:hypothetical protein
MPVSRERRLWDLRAYGDGNENDAQCQFPYYSEKKGVFLGCKQRGKTLLVAKWVVEDVGETEIPFCRRHFGVLYPDVAQARQKYPTDTQSFKKMPQHPTKITDQAVNRYLLEQGQEVISRYALHHPEDKRPKK